MLGAIAVAAYLVDSPSWLWPVLGLSAASMLSMRLAFFARLYALFRPRDTDLLRVRAVLIHRLNEGVRFVLLGAGLAMLLLAGEHLGWLPVLAASIIAIVEGTTGFSLVAFAYAGLKVVAGRRPPAPDPAAPAPWNKNCLVCRVLDCGPYSRCRWCRLESLWSCCGLQTSLLLALLMVVAFLLNASLTPLVTKILVTTSILGVAGLGLAIHRQTDDLIKALDDHNTTVDKLTREREAESRRCDFLRRLSCVTSAEDAASAAMQHIERSVGARRISVMVEEQGMLRILASRGIPADVAAGVSVRIDSGICGLVFSTGRAVVFRNVMLEMPDMAIGLEACGGAVSLPLVSAPMGANGRKIGCINVTDHPGGEFSRQEISELEFTAEATGISISAHKARGEVDQANYDVMRALVMTVEAKDPYTHGHSLRVQAWALETARKLGLDPQHLQMLSYAGELHDIGKLAVPDGVLNSPRSLTDGDWAIIRQHPVRGVEMIEHIRFLRPALAAIRHHHERLDGRGYPDGLSGDEIPLEARILAVVDSYDAMTSSRSYRTPLPHEAAAAELHRYAGTQFDPACVEAFLALLGDAGEPALAGQAEKLA